MKPFSVAIITYNEEDRIRDCIESVLFADDIVVVDSCSTDRTTTIARELGARVIVEPWRGFALQKQFAVDNCKNDWVLILDADERVPPWTKEIIISELKDNQKDITAYSFKRKNYMNNKWIRHSGWWPDRIIRLVRKDAGYFEKRSVHEKWITKGKIKELNAYIEHLSFRDYSEMVKKMNLYSTLSAHDLKEKGTNVHAISPLSHGLWMFFRTYVLERGIFDGFEGLMISVMNAMGSFLKYAKLRELKRD